MPNSAYLGKIKHDNERLKEEIASLRAALALQDSLDVDTWAQHAPQEVRDRMAASAYVAEKLDAPRALKRLGFTIPMRQGGKYCEPIVWVWCDKVFGTPGVKRELAMLTKTAQENREAIVKRTTEIALHGSDGDSVRATQQLAKMCDWNEGDKKVAEAGAAKVTLMQMLGSSQNANRVQSEVRDPDAIIDAETFLAHEPEETGVAVIDDEEPKALTA